MSWWAGGGLIRTIATVVISITTPHARNAQIVVADEVTVSAVVQTRFTVICQVKVVRAGAAVPPSGLQQTKAGTGGVYARGGEGRLTQWMNDLKYERETTITLGLQEEWCWCLQALIR